jgi:hypothetical protein
MAKSFLAQIPRAARRGTSRSPIIRALLGKTGRLRLKELFA